MPTYEGDGSEKIGRKVRHLTACQGCVSPGRVCLAWLGWNCALAHAGSCSSGDGQEVEAAELSGTPHQEASKSRLLQLSGSLQASPGFQTRLELQQKYRGSLLLPSWTPGHLCPMCCSLGREWCFLLSRFLWPRGPETHIDTEPK